MKNREVLDADACGELVVNNAVEDGCDDASDRDFKGFHPVVGVEQILTDVEISRLHLSLIGREGSHDIGHENSISVAYQVSRVAMARLLPQC